MVTMISKKNLTVSLYLAGTRVTIVLVMDQYSDSWMLELDYYDVEKGNVFDNRIIALFARTSYDLSLRNQAFIKVGANHYDYSLKGDFKDSYETGIGYALGAGWQYNFDMGLSISIEANKMKHSSIESTIVDYSMSYRF